MSKGGCFVRRLKKTLQNVACSFSSALLMAASFSSDNAQVCMNWICGPSAVISEECSY